MSSLTTPPSSAPVGFTEVLGNGDSAPAIVGVKGSTGVDVRDEALLDFLDSVEDLPRFVGFPEVCRFSGGSS